MYEARYIRLYCSLYSLSAVSKNSNVQTQDAISCGCLISLKLRVLDILKLLKLFPADFKRKVGNRYLFWLTVTFALSHVGEVSLRPSPRRTKLFPLSVARTLNHPTDVLLLKVTAIHKARRLGCGKGTVTISSRYFGTGTESLQSSTPNRDPL